MLLRIERVRLYIISIIHNVESLNFRVDMVSIMIYINFD